MIEDYLRPQDRANLLLVLAGKKPATELEPTKTFEQADDKGSYNDFTNTPAVHQTRQQLETLDISYQETVHTSPTHHYDNTARYWLDMPNQTTWTRETTFYVGRDKESLETLLNAETHFEQGRAYGYPVSAVSTWMNTINGRCRDASYLTEEVWKAKQHNVDIPPFLSTISFVPAHVDILNQRYDEGTLTVGKAYEESLRKQNENLLQDLYDDMIDFIPDKVTRKPAHWKEQIELWAGWREQGSTATYHYDA